MEATQERLNGDEELLKTGFFSDVKVICGHETWDLHKNILCTRSTFFKKALTETGRVELHEQDPTEVGWVITFIYTSEASPDLTSLLEDQNTMADTCVRLLTIGDYFGLDGLGDMVARVLYANHMAAAKKVQRTQDPTRISDEFVNGFFQTAATAYACCPSSFASLRESFAKFFELSRFLVLKDQRFRAQLRKIPELSHDVLMLLVKHEYEGDDRCMVLFDRPPRCNGCRREGVKFFPLTWVERGEDITLDRITNRWDGIGPEGYCEQCARVFEEVPDAFPAIEDW
ncbi:hypothetical protein DL766_005153 [Monosporascus sp. MC13-8B]|uniref:BTB domain-containing protein n=1 Tax=Monosporascus cannonballus TaxID=155416 RepID=A0ABY0HIM9_9PEZI|nr:hypothetical protein DL763_005681 [Monosporascus cannonballus]RYO94307.1 hypothetical protein DL762_000631 [Monosporascus cannonballus]RYP29854.1 hypothetical protein DL766_005153 [Monosporascus sp. MC13-8B]